MPLVSEDTETMPGLSPVHKISIISSSPQQEPVKEVPAEPTKENFVAQPIKTEPGDTEFSKCQMAQKQMAEFSCDYCKAQTSFPTFGLLCMHIKSVHRAEYIQVNHKIKLFLFQNYGSWIQMRVHCVLGSKFRVIMGQILNLRSF